MDNKTHMMFHDQDIREETQKVTTAKNFAIFKQVLAWKDSDESNEIIAAKLKDKYNLDDKSIHQLLP